MQILQFFDVSKEESNTYLRVTLVIEVLKIAPCLKTFHLTNSENKVVFENTSFIDSTFVKLSIK